MLKEGGLKWQWSDHKDSIFNQNLGSGGDFGFEPPGLGLKYMPAIDRYCSDFYANLGEDGKIKLLSSGHHVLILAGLYGLLCPLEPVQMYDCILDENNENYRIWKREQGLTRVLSDYIRKKGIIRIFEFTSIHDYRDVIDWPYLKDKNKDLEIFHCYYKHADGEKGLSPLGKFVRETFLEIPLEKLLEIKEGFECEHILFSTQQCRTDKVVKRPLPRNWKKLNLDCITDKEVKSHFETAEGLVRTLYRSPKQHPDAGSPIWIEYTKGLEKMLHFEIARQIRAYAFVNYATDSWYLDKIDFQKLPEQLRDILQANEEHVKYINPRGWASLRKTLKEYSYGNKFFGEVLKLLEQKYNKDFENIESVCTYFSRYRDQAAHTAVYSLDDLIPIRNEIIKNLNLLIDLFYDKYKLSLETLIKNSHSPDMYKRLDAIMALGRSGSEGAINPLLEALSDNKAIIRGFAVESLGQLGNNSASEKLFKYWNKEKDPEVRRRMQRVYQQL